MKEELPCDISGICRPSSLDEDVTNCVYCGKELIKKDGKWYTWDADFHPQQKPQY